MGCKSSAEAKPTSPSPQPTSAAAPQAKAAAAVPQATVEKSANKNDPVEPSAPVAPAPANPSPVAVSTSAPSSAADCPTVSQPAVEVAQSVEPSPPPPPSATTEAVPQSVSSPAKATETTEVMQGEVAVAVSQQQPEDKEAKDVAPATEVAAETVAQLQPSVEEETTTGKQNGQHKQASSGKPHTGEATKPAQPELRRPTSNGQLKKGKQPPAHHDVPPSQNGHSTTTTKQKPTKAEKGAATTATADSKAKDIAEFPPLLGAEGDAAAPRNGLSYSDFLLESDVPQFAQTYSGPGGEAPSSKKGAAARKVAFDNDTMRKSAPKHVASSVNLSKKQRAALSKKNHESVGRRGPVASRYEKGSKSQMQTDVYLQMASAFERLLTNADTINAQLDSR